MKKSSRWKDKIICDGPIPHCYMFVGRHSCVAVPVGDDVFAFYKNGCLMYFGSCCITYYSINIYKSLDVFHQRMPLILQPAPFLVLPSVSMFGPQMSE